MRRGSEGRRQRGAAFPGSRPKGGGRKSDFQPLGWPPSPVTSPQRAGRRQPRQGGSLEQLQAEGRPPTSPLWAPRRPLRTDEPTAPKPPGRDTRRESVLSPVWAAALATRDDASRHKPRWATQGARSTVDAEFPAENAPPEKTRAPVASRVPSDTPRETAAPPQPLLNRKAAKLILRGPGYPRPRAAMLQANHRHLPGEHRGKSPTQNFSKSNPTMYSIKMHGDQVGFLLRIQGWFIFENLSV